MKKEVLICIFILLSGFFLTGCTELDYLSQTNDAQQEIEEDSLITQCKENLEECKDIANQKWGTSISTIKVERFENLSEAKVFYTTWNAVRRDLRDILYINTPYGVPVEDNFPLVLFAIKIKGTGGQVPAVIICNKNGEIADFEKYVLSC
jgi:hypothetical protein